jgi:uncharacterized protein
MKATEEKRFCCAIEPGVSLKESNAHGAKSQALKYFLYAIPLFGVWFVITKSLAPFSKCFTPTLLGLEVESHLAGALEFFAYDTPKVLLLLTLVVFGVGVMRSFSTPV